MSIEKDLHPTYLKDCECKSTGIIIHESEAFCRWCLKRFAEGGNMFYHVADFIKSKTVKQKDYEVMSGTQSPYPAPLEILSVKRISDGEIFSVGDLTDAGNKIISFTEHQGCLSVLLEGKDKHRWGTNLASIEKAKPVILFTTKDGVGIREGDTFYYTPKETLCYISACCRAIPQPEEGFYYFSTKEAAEDFVLHNTPILCLKDLLSVWDGGINNYPSVFYEAAPLFKIFKKKAKEKLQK